MKSAVIYTRQRGKDNMRIEQQSLDVQVRIMEACARANDFQIIDRVVQAGVSTLDLTRELIAILNEGHKVDAVITYSMSRFCCSFPDVAYLQDLLIQHSIKLLLAGESNVTFLFPSIQEEYIYHLLVAIQRGQSAKAVQGIWPSCARIGYRSVVMPPGQRRIVPDAYSASKVIQIFTEYATGLRPSASLLVGVNREAARGHE